MDTHLCVIVTPRCFGNWEAAAGCVVGSQASCILAGNRPVTSYWVPEPATGGGGWGTGMLSWELELVIMPVPFFFLIRLLEWPILAHLSIFS